EGEVDYRYMPDADLPPLVIGQDLVKHLTSTLPTLPDQLQQDLQDEYNLSLKDAKTLIDLDNGDRLDFFLRTVHSVTAELSISSQAQIGKMVGNWVLHELGGLLTAHQRSWDDARVTADELRDILVCLHQKRITTRVAKQLLADLFQREPAPAARPCVEQLIETGNLRLRPLSEEEYRDLARRIMDESPEMVKAVREKGQKGKVMWFVGQMVRQGEEGTVEPEQARATIERLMGG
ncbi:hypothetical protein LTR33_016526, partial [Friedmanniomyces endolithicus]